MKLAFIGLGAIGKPMSERLIDNGYDLNLVERARKHLSCQLVSLGGAGQISDLKKIIKVGADAAAAGSFFSFHGKYKAVLISYPTYNEIKQISS